MSQILSAFVAEITPLHAFIAGLCVGVLVCIGAVAIIADKLERQDVLRGNQDFERGYRRGLRDGKRREVGL